MLVSTFSFCVFPVCVLTIIIGVYINFGFRLIDLEVKIRIACGDSLLDLCERSEKKK